MPTWCGRSRDRRATTGADVSGIAGAGARSPSRRARSRPRVLVGNARCLHHAVKRHVLEDEELAEALQLRRSRVRGTRAVRPSARLTRSDGRVRSPGLWRRSRRSYTSRKRIGSPSHGTGRHGGERTTVVSLVLSTGSTSTTSARVKPVYCIRPCAVPPAANSSAGRFASWSVEDSYALAAERWPVRLPLGNLHADGVVGGLVADGGIARAPGTEADLVAGGCRAPRRPTREAAGRRRQGRSARRRSSRPARRSASAPGRRAVPSRAPRALRRRPPGRRRRSSRGRALEAPVRPLPSRRPLGCRPRPRRTPTGVRACTESLSRRPCAGERPGAGIRCRRERRSRPRRASAT